MADQLNMLRKLGIGNTIRTRPATQAYTIIVRPIEVIESRELPKCNFCAQPATCVSDTPYRYYHCDRHCDHLQVAGDCRPV